MQRRQGVDGFGEPRQHRGPAGVETGVEIDRRDHRFQGVSQDRVAAMTAGFHFARTQQDPLAQFKLTRQRGEGGFAHQLGAGAGEVAFGGLGPAQIERLGDERPDQGVAEEFQTLVVRGGGAAMGQRPFQQARIAEDMPTEAMASGCVGDVHHGFDLFNTMRCRRAADR